MRRWAVLLVLTLAACEKAPAPKTLPNLRESAPPSPAGLAPLPCDAKGSLYPLHQRYCRDDLNFVTPAALKVLTSAAKKLAGPRIGYMDASWPSGVKPMPPHYSHGDGRQVDLALFYEDRQGRPLDRSPVAGYGAYEPPRRESERACPGGARGKQERPDPPRDRNWRLDEARTKALVSALIAYPAVRRVFIEPHLKTRLGFAGEGKVRFAGCGAARHDDHIHVDFY